MQIWGTFLAAACLLAVQLVAGTPLSFTEDNFACDRLPINVRPTKYELHLKFPALSSEDYQGQVDIDVEFLNKRPDLLAEWGLQKVECAQKYDANTIILHADKSLEIDKIQVTSQPFWTFVSGSEQKQREVVELRRDEAKQMIAIKVRRGLHGSSQGNPGRISISFRGKMRQDKRGVYVSSYSDGEQLYKHIVSQFQPTDARTVFPSFDEPRFKVPFSVRLSHPAGLSAYGNMEKVETVLERFSVTTRFATTPNMPIHMLAFTIGKFDEPLEVSSEGPLVGRDGRRRARKIRVLTAPGKRRSGRFALQVAKRALEYFEDYIDFEFPLDKLDVVAIADHDKDNTESWGLVFVRDVLAWIDDETKEDTKITTAVNVAHVVVHQWFGNLLSANWWSELWITEGVATQFAFQIVQELFPFQSEFFVRLATLSGIMQLDQPGNQHALSPPASNLSTSDQIYTLFDNLSFMKSGSLAQMVQESLGAGLSGKANYQRVLRSLVKARAFQTISFEDYERAIMEPEVRRTTIHIYDLLKVLMTFPKYSGVPVVNCHVDSNIAPDKLRLDVEPFEEARGNLSEVPQYHRHVYLQLGMEFYGNSREKLQLRKTLTSNPMGAENDHQLPDWFFLNATGGDSYVKIDYEPTIATYYRTRYSDQLYDQLEKAIVAKSIPDMGRLQLLDDASNLARASLITSQRFRSLLDAYAGEEHPAVVLAIIAATRTYRALAPQDSSPLPSDAAVARIFDKYGFETSQKQEVIMQRARSVALKNLVQKADQHVIAAAIRAFETTKGEVELFLREPVYTAVALVGGERVHQLLAHLSETKSYEERIRLVTALTLSKDKEVLTKVKSWLESSGLKPETQKPFLEAIAKGLGQ